MEELIARVTDIMHSFDSGTNVIEVVTPENKSHVLIGRTESREEIGMTYRFGIVGSKNYTNKRTGKTIKQLKFNSFVPHEPTDPDSIIEYLAKAGKGNGLGKATARKLHDALGDNLLAAIREDHGVIAKTLGTKFPEDKAKNICNTLRAYAKEEETRIQLMAMFAHHRIPKSIIGSVVAKMGVEAVEKISRNPYLLMDYHGVGFRKADAMYEAYGLPLNRQKRRLLAALHYLDEARNSGSVWHTADQMNAEAQVRVGGVDITGSNFQKAFRLGLRSKRLAKHWDESGGLWFAEKALADYEGTVAREVVRLAEIHATLWPPAAQIENVTDHQREAYEKATVGRFGVLEGGPGTGKTFTVCEIVKAISEKHSIGTVAVCAPTNKAALRLTSGMRSAGVRLNATTIHKLLGMGRENGTLPYKFIFVDETSMLDLPIVAAFIQRIDPRYTQVMFVGDVNQLPPVGPGAVLRDIIDAGIHSGLLTETKRNEGRIVEVCRQIREGEPIEFSKVITEEENCKLIECAPSQIADKIIFVLKNAQQQGFDPLWDCQPIVPINEKSDVSRKAINAHLQTYFNSKRENIGGTIFRIGDKIVVTDTGESKKLNSTGGFDSCMIFNGSIGTITDGSSIDRYVEFEIDGEGYRQYFKDKDVPLLDLGYAISGHKSQGSEWPVAIPVIDGSGAGNRVSSREWIYTAISRGKKFTFLLGNTKTFNRQIQNIGLRRRKTFLKERILQCLSCHDEKGSQLPSTPTKEESPLPF